MMKRFFFSAMVALFACIPAWAQFRSPLEDLDDSETVRALKEHVAYLSGAQLEGRKAGSEGEKMAAAYLEEQLKAYGVDVLGAGNTFGVAVGGDTLTSRNVTGLLEGWDASGMALLLELARRLSYSRTLLRRSILFVGFGSSCETFAGSWYFLNRAFASDAAQMDAMVNLDMLGTAENGFWAYTASNTDLNTLITSLQGELLPVQATITAQQPYPGDHVVFYDKEIPSVVFTTGRYPEHGTGRDTYSIVDFEGMEKELEYIYSFVQRLANGPRPLFRESSASSAAKPAVGVYAYSDVDIKPMFLNSPDPAAFMERWVYQYLKYPRYAQENGIQGRVLVDFMIDEKGEVRDVKIARGVHESLDEEALRVVSASPKWRPGRHRGKKCKVALTIAVDFKLSKSKGKFGINGKTIN